MKFYPFITIRSKCCVGTQCLSLDQANPIRGRMCYLITWPKNRKCQTLNSLIHKHLLFWFGSQFAQNARYNFYFTTLLRLELHFSLEHVRKHKKRAVKQRRATFWPRSRSWLVVANLIFFFLWVASDKCTALFPLATEKSRCGRVKLMYASHSDSLAGAD